MFSQPPCARHCFGHFISSSRSQDSPRYEIPNKFGSFVFPQGLRGEQIEHGTMAKRKILRTDIPSGQSASSLYHPKPFSLICKKYAIILKILNKSSNKTKSPQAVIGLMRKRIQTPHSATSSRGTIIIIITVNFFSVCACSISHTHPSSLIHALYTHTFNFYNLISFRMNHIQRPG